jgi:hypothetical protein
VSIVMSLRLISCPQTANVLPLRPPTNTAEPQLEVQSPEPERLYHLIVLALLLHQPATDWTCQSCKQLWPCEQVRLACRLREGF